jgi:flagellar motor switch/type III secretory pathway protein FliN
LTTLLNKKISLASETDKQSLGAAAQLEALFAPLHKQLCESLKALTGSDCEEAGLTVTALKADAQQSMIESASIKVIFPDLHHNVKAIGTLSPMLANYVAQKSFQISDNETDTAETYKPSKLDALLLRPVPLKIAEALSALFAPDTILQSQTGLSFDALKFGKSQMKEFGELVQVSLQFKFTEPKSQAKDKPESETSTSELWVQIFLQAAQLESLLQSSATGEISDALVIDTAHPWALHMRDAVKKADMPIRAVVETCHMTIAECTRLEIGQVIALPGVSLNSVGIFIDLETGDAAETDKDVIELTKGSLGIFKKNRALKLIENIDPSFTHDCDWLTI